MRFWSVALLSVLVFSAGTVQSQPGRYGYGPGMARQAQAPAPSAILQQGLKKLMKFVGGKQRPNPKQLAAFLNTEIAPYFDFDYMARWSSGPRWHQMNEKQRGKMASKLKQNFLGTLAKKLKGFSGQNYTMPTTRRGRGGVVSVNVSIQNPGRYPARMKFRFYRSSDGWKVFDVEANGNSALAYYRQYFRSQTPGYRSWPRYR